jgi:hypothetical protein
VFTDSSIYLSLYLVFDGRCSELFVATFITIVLPSFGASF